MPEYELSQENLDRLRRLVRVLFDGLSIPGKTRLIQEFGELDSFFCALRDVAPTELTDRTLVVRSKFFIPGSVKK